MAEEKINMNIDDGLPFFAHELSVNFNPTQVIMDFKCITPRMDPRSRDKPSINMKHNVVMLDPYHAKKIVGVLNNVIKKYEEEFGKIDKPKAVKAMEKKKKKKGSKKKEKVESPTYFG